MITKKQLEKLYVQKQLSCRQVGEIIGKSAKQVWRLLKKHDIPLRPQGVVKPIPIDAKTLRRLYEEEGLSTVEIGKKYNRAPNTVSYWLSQYGIQGRKQSHHQWASDNPMWKGGIHIKNGYRFIKKPKHPNANGKGYVAEHRLVMEAKLGRYLSRDEQVHHINEVKHDNRPENLEIMTCSEHSRRHRLKEGKRGPYKKRNN